MPNPVTIADLEARFRPLTAAEATNAQAWLDDAWEVVLERVPTVDARLADGTLRPGLVVKVVAAMVLRVLRNPDSVRQWSVDDTTIVRDNAVSSGALYLADDELAELASGGAVSSAFTIRAITPGVTYQPDPWAS